MSKLRCPPVSAALLIAAVSCARIDAGAAELTPLPLTDSALTSDVQALPGLPYIWQYTEVEGARCRDGSPAGVATNFVPGSKKLMIYLEGGGFCLDETSCSVNFAKASDQTALLGTLIGVGGWFDRLALDNPLRDFNFVYVPYCTGDLFSGANPFGNVPGVGAQRFVGYLNMQRFLPRIAATFPDATNVVLSGGSAGAIGAIRTSLLVQRAFPEVRFGVVSDSGPPLSKAVYAPCLQRRERELFALDETILAECGAACPDPDNAWLDFSVFAARQLRDRPLGLIQSLDDWGIAGFLGAGNDGCTDPDLQRTIPAEALHAELLQLRARFAELPNFSTFYLASDNHTWTSGAPLQGFGDYQSARAGTLRLTEWLGIIARGDVPAAAGP